MKTSSPADALDTRLGGRPGGSGAPSRRAQWAGFLGVIVLSVAAAFWNATWEAEGRWRDVAFRFLALHAPLPTSGRVALVGLDEDDLRSLAVPLALMHRPLGSFLEALVQGGAAGVGLDVGLPETSFDALIPGGDAALARGIVVARRGTHLVVGLGVNQGGQAQPLQPAFAALLGPQRQAWLVVLPDRDGVVRRFDERLAADGGRLATLAGQLARATGVPVDEGLIHYAHGGPWQAIPLRQVLAWQAAGDVQALRSAFEGRLVLFGSLLAYEDQHRTPLSLVADPEFSGTSHGVLVHAQQLRNLVDGRIIQPLSWPAVAAGWLLCVLPWWWRPGWRTGAAATALAAALWLAGAATLREGAAIPVVGWTVALALAVSSRSVWAGWLASRERARLRASFSGLVSPAVLEEIVSGRLDTQSAGARREVCVLFSDIRGFTSMSENMAPEQVTALLNRYFERMATAIHRHGGMLDKFIGDGIMAVFGAPQPNDRSCDQAFAAACEMLQELERVNQDQARRGEPLIRVGIGLHHGPVVIGYVGSLQRFEYSAIGDTVNTASRIESLTKDCGCPLLLSSAVLRQMESPPALVSLGFRPLRGRSDIEVFGFDPSVGQVGNQGDGHASDS